MNQNISPVSCDFDPLSITAEAAMEKILKTARPLQVVETVAIREALGRVLAEDLVSAVKVPNHTNSAMNYNMLIVFVDSFLNHHGVGTLGHDCPCHDANALTRLDLVQKRFASEGNTDNIERP